MLDLLAEDVKLQVVLKLPALHQARLSDVKATLVFVNGDGYINWRLRIMRYHHRMAISLIEVADRSTSHDKTTSLAAHRPERRVWWWVRFLPPGT